LQRLREKARSEGLWAPHSHHGTGGTWRPLRSSVRWPGNSR
jgi:hypothetical protein